MEEYLNRPGKLKPSSKAEMRRHIELVCAAWLDKPIVSITEEDIRKRHREMATKGLRGKGPAPGQANLSMTTLRALINFASRQRRRADGSPLFLYNPVEVLKDHWAKLGTRTQRYIDKRTIGTVWNALHEARANPKSLDALAGIDLTLFLLLTGARRNEGAKQMALFRSNPSIQLPIPGMAALLKHNKTTLPAEDYEPEREVPTFTLWQGSADRKVVYTLTFDPSAGEFCTAEDGRPAYNLWKPRPLNPPADWQQRAQLFVDHVAFLVPMPAERERFLDWLAHIEQKPGVLPHSHYLMIATQQGVGRNWMAGVLAHGGKPRRRWMLR